MTSPRVYLSLGGFCRWLLLLLQHQHQRMNKISSLRVPIVGMKIEVKERSDLDGADLNCNQQAEKIQMGPQRQGQLRDREHLAS